MKVYVTRYALTQGVLEMEAQRESPSMISVQLDGFRGYYHGSDWHESQAAAKDRAETMRSKKIKALQEQIAKLKQLKFDTIGVP